MCPLWWGSFQTSIQLFCLSLFLLVMVCTIQPVDREQMPLFCQIHQNLLPSAVHELRLKHKSQEFWSFRWSESYLVIQRLPLIAIMCSLELIESDMLLWPAVSGKLENILVKASVLGSGTKLNKNESESCYWFADSWYLSGLILIVPKPISDDFCRLNRRVAWHKNSAIGKN